MSKNIVLIDDDSNILGYMRDHLSNNNYRVKGFTSARKALKEIDQEAPDLVITDVKMDEMTGDDVLNHIRKNHPETGVILVTGFGNISHSVNAMRKGAFDYITKPFTGKEFLHRIQQFFDHVSQPLTDNGSGIETLKGSEQATGKPVQNERTGHKKAGTKRHIMVGDSPKIKHLIEILRQIAPTNAPILIQGESGTGKEVYANLIQQNSDRANKPYVKINCANLPSELVESTLFGHEKGSFTGAVEEKEGAFKEADGGTLLLDEITEIDINIQAKLLRVLQEKEFNKVGSQKPQSVDVRIIATTNRNVGQAINSGEFRSDLYYRINVFPVIIPPLRDRSKDIPTLAHYFCEKFCSEYGFTQKEIDDDLEELLKSKTWTGNVRELENYIMRAVIMAQNDDVLGIDHAENGLFRNIDDDLANEVTGDFPLMAIDEMELIMIKKALERTSGNQKEAAKLLNVSDRTIRNKLKKIDFPAE